MRKVLATLVLTTALSGPVLAETVPVPGRQDGRMRTVAYDPNNVTVVTCVSGLSTSVEFDSKEVVDQVAVGDDKSWVVAPVGNRVFITPNPPTQTSNSMSPNVASIALRPETPPTVLPSNMQVVTKRPDGSTRLYQIALASSANTSGAIFGVRYIYPDDARAERVAEWKKQKEAEIEQVATGRLATSFFYGPRNWRYISRGNNDIDPSEISDNGRDTVFRFPGNTKMPSIHTGQCGDQKEVLASGNVQDDLVIVQTTSQYFCLRLGATKVAEIRNIGYDPVGYNPRTGTDTPDVVRTVKAKGARR